MARRRRTWSNAASWLIAACGHPAPPVANTAADDTDPATCVPETSAPIDARVVDGALLACFGGSADRDDCWRIDPATGAWRFSNRRPRARRTAPEVTTTASTATACRPDGGCRTVPLAGVAVRPDAPLSGAANGDLSLVAVWADGPVYVFDAAGKRRATIAPWPTPMTGGNGPSTFRAAHVLDHVLEVRIADTPVSSAIRLYDALTGRWIADVFGGQPMDDTLEPIALGGTRYAFVTLDTHAVLVVDVATGAQLASYPLIDGALSPTVFAWTSAGLAAVSGTTVFTIDARGTLSRFAAPPCDRQTPVPAV